MSNKPEVAVPKPLHDQFDTIEVTQEDRGNDEELQRVYGVNEGEGKDLLAERCIASGEVKHVSNESNHRVAFSGSLKVDNNSSNDVDVNLNGKIDGKALDKSINKLNKKVVGSSKKRHMPEDDSGDDSPDEPVLTPATQIKLDDGEVITLREYIVKLLKEDVLYPYGENL